MSNLLWHVFEISINFYQGALATLFIYKFLTPKSQNSAKIGGAVFAFTEGSLVTVLNYFSVFEGFGSVLYWLNLFAFAFCFFSDNLIKKILSVAIPQIIILLVTTVELNVISSLFKVTVSELVVNQNSIRFLALIIIQISILILFIIAAKIFKYADEYTFSDWFAIVLVLITSFVLVAIIHTLSLKISVEERIYINLSYLVIIIINFLMFYIIHSLFIKNQKLKEMELLKLREQYLEQFIGNVQSQYDSIRKIRHDIKDKYTTIYRLIKDGKYDGAEAFISSNYRQAERAEPFVRTNNDIVNAIINEKLTTAFTLGIKVSCITVADFDGISDSDLCDLLSNMLENAVTACKNITGDMEKCIFLRIDKEDNVYTFLVRNSIQESVLSSNPKLITTKKDRGEHGFGTAIIRDIAQKYNGRCDFYESDNMFCCKVMMLTQSE